MARSMDDKVAIVREIEQLKAQGTSTEAACKQVGVSSPSNYYLIRKSVEQAGLWSKDSPSPKTRTATIVHHYPKENSTTEPPKVKKTHSTKNKSARCFLVFGSPKDLAEYVREVESA